MTHELLSLLKEDSQRHQQRDEPFFTLMERMLTTPVTTTQPVPFTFDRASNYYMMQQPSFQTPTTYCSKEYIGKTIKKYPAIPIIQERLKTFEHLNSYAITWLYRYMLKQSSEN